MRHRRRRSTHTKVVIPVPTTPPPCAAVAHTVGSGAFNSTMVALLVAEIELRLDAPFFLESRAAQTAAQSTSTTALSEAPESGRVSASGSSPLHDQAPRTSQAPLDEARTEEQADSSSVANLVVDRTAASPLDCAAIDGQSAGDQTRRMGGAEAPGGDEQQLPPVAAYQTAIIKSMVRAAGVVRSRLPPLNMIARNRTSSVSKTSVNSSSPKTTAATGSEQLITSAAPSNTSSSSNRALLTPQLAQGEPASNLNSSESTDSSVQSSSRLAVKMRAAHYAQVLKKVVSGEYLLGESDELMSDDEGSTAQHDTGASGSTTEAEAKVKDAGSELLLAITLEAFTDLCRYPRYVSLQYQCSVVFG